ncbi:beta-N-acetylhexosaminidase [Nibricoccus sp. IMCC34717]|uniref:beta-N-acetylhexosaminidase n=1 Tax=Nibricoccus sp. IMCC34717 TaxID=3034021 RepID=UPI0038500169
MSPLKLALGLATMSVLPFAHASRPHLMPLPANVRVAGEQLSLAGGLQVVNTGVASSRVEAAAARLNTSLGKPAAGTTPAKLVLNAKAAAPVYPSLHDDESYTLSVATTEIRLDAATDLGLLRGLATLRQAVRGSGASATVPLLEISDSPRFPWRGLMVDVCRHWIPPEALRRQLDLMASVKLNVLHLHITEDQGFRIESKKFPRLHELGSDGKFYTQEEIRAIVAYAAERGIRVVPELDMPGHTASWLVAHPEFGSLPGPNEIVRRWGIFDPVLDPTNEALYPFLDTLLGEMAALFPDPYFHIGGDEVNGVHWNANPAIQGFIREHKLGDNKGLQAYFNRRLASILGAHGKKIIGWDEILHPNMPCDVIHSWRGTEGLREAVRRGKSALLSHGFYIDLIHPAIDHYRNDPLPAGSDLTPAEQARVLGGEATMWSEWVDSETIDSRVWPRTAAIAERLWSPREVCADESDLYARLDTVAALLEADGSLHSRYLDSRLPRVAGSAKGAAALRTLVDAIEPVKVYRRMGFQPEMTSLDPLETLADHARPDSASSRRLNAALASLLAGDNSGKSAGEARAQLEAWREATAWLATESGSDTRAWREARVMAARLNGLADTGLRALAAFEARAPLARDEAREGARRLLEAHRPTGSATEFVFINSLRRLLAAATDPAGFNAAPAAERETWLAQRTPPYEQAH